MLGRLARYLRFFGHDVESAHGSPDAEILRRAIESGRTLLTRDRMLAARTPGALLLHAHSIAGQLRELRAARPGLSVTPRFDRCPDCNAPLVRAELPYRLEPRHPRTDRRLVPPTVAFQCPHCGQLYWEGSHTARIRSLVRGWLDGPIG